MSINPNDITTIRVGQLPIGDIALDSILPVENDTELQQITGQQLVDFVNVNASTLQYTIQERWVNQAYIDTNFDNTGLGILIETGFAICNGQNGTPNLDGLVSIGYGANYPVIKAVGGSKNAVVVEHDHLLAYFNTSPTTTDISSTNYLTRIGESGGDGAYVLRGNAIAPNVGKSSTSGIDGTNKNMQPYMVLLKVMKL